MLKPITAKLAAFATVGLLASAASAAPASAYVVRPCAQTGPQIAIAQRTFVPSGASGTWVVNVVGNCFAKGDPVQVYESGYYPGRSPFNFEQENVIASSAGTISVFAVLTQGYWAGQTANCTPDCSYYKIWAAPNSGTGVVIGGKGTSNDIFFDFENGEEVGPIY